MNIEQINFMLNEIQFSFEKMYLFEMSKRKFNYVLYPRFSYNYLSQFINLI